MSQCEKFQDLISRLVDGDLSAREEADLRKHIESCPECAALYSAFSAISRQIGDGLEEAPFDLRENVMAEIRREELRKKNRLPTILRTVLSTAACAAVIVGVYLGVSLGKSDGLSAAVYDTAPAAAAEEKATITAMEEGVEPEEAVEEAVLAEEPMEFSRYEEAPAEPAAMRNDMVAEEPAPAEVAETEDLYDADNSGAEQGDAALGAAAVEVPVLDFSHWDLALFRELMGGLPASLTLEELEPSLIATVLVRSGSELCQISLYELEDRLYYYDPVSDTVYNAELSPSEWEAFLG